MLPHPVRVEDLFFSTTEVSNGQFSQFITARPEWAPSNREALTAEGLVTEDYLSHWNGNSVPEELRDLPVTYVSYYAARAYCSWLTEVLPGQFSGYSADLPTEQEWERAALAAESSTGQAVLGRRGDTGPSPISRSDTPLLQDMMGNVWEWCSDWFFPAEYLLLTGEGAAFAEQALFPGAEKSVRGGAWINHPEEIEPTVRGAQPPEWCTPFLGFRPVLRVNP